MPCLFRGQIYYEQSINLGTIPEAAEIKGDVILQNRSDARIFLMRADADQGVKVYTSKKTLQPGDTCLIVISFEPGSAGKFKKRIGLVTSDKATPYEVYISGKLERLKRDDKTACYYFGARRNSMPATTEPIVVPDTQQPRDNSNRLPDPTQAVISPSVALTKPSPKQTPELQNPAQLPVEDYKPNNIVFLVDVSGSMRDSLKLPLMKTAMHVLVDAVRDIDRVCLVTYADTVKTLVEGISGADKPILHRMVDSLYAKGQTKGNKAILFSQLLAQRYFIEGGNNQILMATDGKFSFRVKDQGVWSQRQGTKPVVLSTVAFGGDREAMANLKGIARIGGGSFIHIRKRDGSRDKLLEEVKNRSRR